MKKKILIGFTVILLAAATWYLFIKPYDYVVRFKVKTFPGVVNQTIKKWSSSLESSKIISSETIDEVHQELMILDAKTSFLWKISPDSDSTSTVKVYATDLNNNLKNKLQIPFSETVFEKETQAKLLNFHELLKSHLAAFKVSEVSQEKLEDTYVLYVPVKTTQQQKARGMMEYYPILDQLIAGGSSLKSNGLPFIEVTYWNQQNDSLHYNFCYPILPTGSLTLNSEVKYKLFKGGKALRAVYNGNYITSDRGWYKLLDYAKKTEVEVLQNPVEVFFNNPNYGGDETGWKTEVFLPLKKE